jgi:hypothetical protein
MSDIDVENYKKSVSKIVDEWGKEAARIAKELEPISAELDQLDALKTPTPDDKKKADDLRKKRDALRQEMENASASLELNLKVIEPPPKADEKELDKIPPWLKEIIKKKGIPLGNVTIAPNINFDFKKKKLKSLGITIKW